MKVQEELFMERQAFSDNSKMPCSRKMCGQRMKQINKN
jgi:hypothetical protein